MTDELTKGYHRFRQNRWPSERAEYEALAANGQKPHTLVVACSDSRADPALIFDADYDTKWSRALAALGVDAARLSSQSGRA